VPLIHQSNLMDRRRAGTVPPVQAMASTRGGTSSPPGFVRLLAHPLRWRLLCELVRSDRAVRELTELVAEQQSLVSYHLGQLRSGGLVRSRRSSADGRDSYYSVDLAGCRDQLHGVGAALHPGLTPGTAPPSRDRTTARRRKIRVLFLCTGNSARSQIAEALLRSKADGRIDVVSAGSHPKVLHPNAVRVMRRRGIDISAQRAKHLDEFAARRFDVVITLCDRIKEVCPDFPGHPDQIHWSVPDPALAGPNDRATLPAFERLAADLDSRIEFLLHQFDTPTTGRTTHDR
jgi:protein-tyrosine-phosphatase/DNA-binding transcriptional ArsR family regulator